MTGSKVSCDLRGYAHHGKVELTCKQWPLAEVRLARYRSASVDAVSRSRLHTSQAVVVPALACVVVAVAAVVGMPPAAVADSKLVLTIAAAAAVPVDEEQIVAALPKL